MFQHEEEGVGMLCIEWGERRVLHCTACVGEWEEGVGWGGMLIEWSGEYNSRKTCWVSEGIFCLSSV